MATKPQTPAKLAILDDYLDLASPHFQHVENVDKVVFKDTLPAWSHPKTTDADRKRILERLSPFTILSTMRERTPFPGDLLRQLPNLKLLLCTGTQLSTFDLTTAKELGIHVAAVTGKRKTASDIRKGGVHPTTQHAWALILALARNVAADDRIVKTGGWQTAPATGLMGKTLGVVGLGRLGAAVAKIGVQAWGMRVLAWSENLTQEKADAVAQGLGLPVVDALGGGDGAAAGKGEEEAKTFQVVSKAELFARADVVSIHYVLSERSRGVVGESELALMKESALLVNTSRGPLVDEDALLRILEKGGIRGAAIDVFDIEPLPQDSAWRSLKWGQEGRSQVLLTPHMGYVEGSMMNAWYAETAENLTRWVQGEELLDRLI
ncbi:MAG: hypothetical protein M1821_003015 [Bathelium mastoideum]|nr:MAG: hypothetical protein M1821_003015 [Bathelium mastoideum]